MYEVYNFGPAILGFYESKYCSWLATIFFHISGTVVNVVKVVRLDELG